MKFTLLSLTINTLSTLVIIRHAPDFFVKAETAVLNQKPNLPDDLRFASYYEIAAILNEKQKLHYQIRMRTLLKMNVHVSNRHFHSACDRSSWIQSVQKKKKIEINLINYMKYISHTNYMYYMNQLYDFLPYVLH
jgi:hypothetical protein